MLRVYVKHFFLAVLLSVLSLPQIVYASDPPNLISPSDNSTLDKSPKLTWGYTGECVQSGSCFRVEVDNNVDFSSPEKSTYTNNFSYSPQNLSEGNWNWRVKSKDKSEKWSEWSNVFKFTISNQSISVSPSPISQTPQPSPTPQTSSKPQVNFTVKDIPSEINSNQEFEALISLTLPNNPNQTFYLKGAFKKDGSSNYFGKTSTGSDWIGNNEKYSKQFKITTGSEGNWEGKIKVRPDSDDSGFDGTGSYIFKIGRYSESGSGPTWSNELTIKITAIDNPKLSPSPTNEPEEAMENDEKIDFTASLVKIPSKNYEIKIASVAGEATISNNINPEEKTKVLEEKRVNWLLIISGMCILAGGFGYIYYKLRKEKLNAKSFN